MIKVTFTPSNIVGVVPEGSTILQAAIAAGVQVESTCGGKGTCGKCKVKVSIDNPSPVSKSEERFLSEFELSEGWVLACQRKLSTDTVVSLRELKDAFKRKTDFDKTQKIVETKPSVRKYNIVLSKPSVEDQTPDWNRLLSSLPQEGIEFNQTVAVTLPRVLRQEKFNVTAVLDQNDLLAVEPGDTTGRCFGLAIDIGTTTVVTYLMDLIKGTVVDSKALTNPQQHFGADVISRITYASAGLNKLEQLQESVIRGLNELIRELCKTNKLDPKEIYQAVVVGNTTMSHLFLGIDPTYLAPAPFIPVYSQSVRIDAKELKLDILPSGKVIVLPNVAGYVGSDTVGVMLAAKVDKLQGNNLIIDIGTNGELVLASNGRILTCSTAAGPAFEGAEIKYGMRAAEGAIEGVQISTDVELKVIGNCKPRGICGSGLIDAIAEMVKTGVIDVTGRLANTQERLDKLPPALRERLTAHEKEFVLVWAKDTSNGEDIVLSQKDVRELQLAKGAIKAGAQILMRAMGITEDKIDQVLLAGAFGNYIKKESALQIGLLPLVSLDKIKAIGNAAGDGAKMALLSIVERQRANTLAGEAEHIELSNRSEFQEEFIEALGF